MTQAPGCRCGRLVVARSIGFTLLNPETASSAWRCEAFKEGPSAKTPSQHRRSAGIDPTKEFFINGSTITGDKIHLGTLSGSVVDAAEDE